MIDVLRIRERLAAQVAKAPKLQGCDQWRQPRLGALPRAVLYSARSPVEASPQRQKVLHTLDVELVVAPKSSMEIAMATMTPLLASTIDFLNRTAFPALAASEANGGLGVALHVAAYQQSERAYAKRVYVTGIIEVTLTEVTGEAYGT